MGAPWVGASVPELLTKSVTVVMRSHNVVDRGNIRHPTSTNDATTWTMKLKPNIRFTDGTPYDANAVKFNWQRLQDPKLAAKTAASANLMQSIDVVDPLTVRITLKQKNAVFPCGTTTEPCLMFCPPPASSITTTVYWPGVSDSKT